MCTMFQSLVWWIRGFKAVNFVSHINELAFQSLVWWIRGFKGSRVSALAISARVSILGLVDKGF